MVKLFPLHGPQEGGRRQSTVRPLGIFDTSCDPGGWAGSCGLLPGHHKRGFLSEDHIAGMQQHFYEDRTIATEVSLRFWVPVSLGVYQFKMNSMMQGHYLWYQIYNVKQEYFA